MYRSLCLAIALIAATSASAGDIDETPIGVVIKPAFTKLSIRRPVVIDHARDGSDRLFVCTQQGVIQVFPNRDDVEEAKVFLDIESRVVYKDSENEEGLLGLAFHPDYAKNGYFFLYYTTTDAPHTSVISRFQVSADDPNQADPQSEVELMRIPQPYWNHNGGTLAFGPDGFLYIGLGDGGKFNDPHMNGQNVQTLLGSILRIDVDRAENGLKYAIPAGNPFKEHVRFACPEIYAWGFRNVWRLSFDRANGTLWAADVGQDVWEEINIVECGKNYGWNLREGSHKFGPVGADARPDLVDPIFEYNHDVGKSITGGIVYRGKSVPRLRGKYLYGDYVSGKLWALEYDAKNKRLIANHPIPSANIPVMTFGEDEAGEVFCSDAFGKIHRFVTAD